ncbi:MAG: Gfo/Idh/MocA family oxidoreductase [Armatimonadetes bacterium]|nr:Gfo/Idh/MocA family oxidoreductase [Armatimonadota bacterium]
MPSTVRVAIIGAGLAGRQHAEAYATLPSTRITVVCDVDRARGEPLATQMGARYAAGVDEALGADVDAVVIALPHRDLEEAALAAAQARKHILLEKPMAAALAGADAILRACRQAGVNLMVGFVHRFRVELRAARALIAAGAIGRPVMIVDRSRSAMRGDHPGWIWRRDVAGGGNLLYTGIHGLDRMRWLLGAEFETAYARTHQTFPGADVENMVAACLTFASGATGIMALTRVHFPEQHAWDTEVYGTDGSIRIRTGVEMVCAGTRIASRQRVEQDDRFLAEAGEFVQAILEDRPPAVTGEDGRAALAAAMAIYRSAAEGKPVRLEPAAP